MSNEKEKRRNDSMLFDYKTVTKHDFRIPKVKVKEQCSYKEKIRIRKEYTPLKDIATLIAWRGPRIPFNLYGQSPKDILRTDPRRVQPPVTRTIDVGREESQRTRPRLIITPMVSIDDIADNNVRELVTSDVYRTSTQMAMEEGVALSNYKTVRAPLRNDNTPYNPIFLPRAKAPLVAPEWRLDSVGWDSRQLRSYTEPEREFWKNYGSLYKACKSCKETAQVVKMRKLSEKRP